MLQLTCKVIAIAVKCERASKFIQVLMDSDDQVQEDLEHVIKVSLSLITWDEEDDDSNLSARTGRSKLNRSNLQIDKQTSGDYELLR
jgi:thiamine monophosphate kinase